MREAIGSSRLPGIAAAVFPAFMSAGVGLKLRTNDGRDFHLLVARIQGRRLDGPFDLGRRRALVRTVPKFDSGFDQEEPSEKEQGDVVE